MKATEDEDSESMLVVQNRPAVVNKRSASRCSTRTLFNNDANL